MRKFILVFCMAVVVSSFSIGDSLASSSVAPHVPAEAVSAGGGSGIDVKIGSDEIQPVIDSNINGANAIIQNLQALGEQILTGMAEVSIQSVATGTGVSQNAASTARGEAGTSIAINNSGLADALCQVGSGAKSGEDVQEHSDEKEDEYVERAVKIANGEAGTDSENGLIDFQRKLFERSLALCSAQGNGGGNSFCTGDGSNKHLTVHTLLGSESLPNGPDIKNESIEYMDDVLFARVPLSIPQDVLDDPSTDVQNLLVESDRLKMEMSVGQSAFSMVRANRVGKTGLTVVDQYSEIMEANGWSENKINEYFNDNGLSVNSMYHALTLGSYGPEYMLNLLSGKGPKGYFAILGQQLMLNNVLQYEQYKLLESIALSSAINIPVNRDDEIKRVNSKIQNIRSGN